MNEQLYSASENTELLVESLGGMDLSHHSEEEQGSHSKSPIREIIPPQEIGIGAKPKTSKVYSLIDYESEVDESEALKWHPISCKGQQTSMAVGACSTPYAAVDKKSHKMDYYRKDQHTQTDEPCLSGSNSDSDSGGKDRRKVRKNKAQRSKRLSKNCDMDCDKNTAKTSAKPLVQIVIRRVMGPLQVQGRQWWKKQNTQKIVGNVIKKIWVLNHLHKKLGHMAMCLQVQGHQGWSSLDRQTVVNMLIK